MPNLFSCTFREAIGFDFLKSASWLFERSPDAGRVLLFRIELLLQRTKEPLAKGMIEDAIAGLCPAFNYTTRVDTWKQFAGCENLFCLKFSAKKSSNYNFMLIKIV